MTTLNEDEARHRAAQMFRCPVEEVQVENLNSRSTNQLYGVRAFDHFMVMKQPRSMDTADEQTEAGLIHQAVEAMRRYRSWQDEAVRVPKVITEDMKDHIIILDGIDGPTGNQLLDGGDGAEVAEALATFIGRVHRRSAEEIDDLHNFTNEPLQQGIIDRVHRPALATLPDCEGEIERAIDDLLDAEQALVHGDYRPENVIAGDDALYLIDFEHAHVGEPLFDLASLVADLYSAGLQNAKTAQPHYDAIRRAFQAYDNAVSWPVGPAFPRQLGVLIAGRPEDRPDDGNGEKLANCSRRLLNEVPGRADGIIDLLKTELH